MKKTYAKSLKEYDKTFELDAKKILAAMKRYKSSSNKTKPSRNYLGTFMIQCLKFIV